MLNGVKSLLDTTHNTPMDNEQAEQFLRCCVAEKLDDQRVLAAEVIRPETGYLPESLRPISGIKIMFGRLRVVTGLSINAVVLLYLSMICDTPANAVMWAFTLADIHYRDPNAGVIDLKRLVDHFPLGFPTKADLQEIWKAQKAPGMPLGNKMDHRDNWIIKPAEQPVT